ncbi:MAG TPA: signal peptidase I [Gammaproteobacteria bacterium]|nr:signal peptidase I [Gammaproteobacteria bacterium]
MDFNFPAIMVSAVFITGIIWALDAFWLAPKRRLAAEGLATQGGDERKLADAKENLLKEPIIVEYARSLFPVILVVLVLRSFLVEPFRIPSGSMMPTLLVGDFILVNKFSYGVRLPVVNTKILDTGEPERGDVVVFRFPKDPSVDYIKRMIGLPGDKVSYYNKQLFINGVPIEQEELGTYIGTGSGVAMSGAKVRLEHLMGVDHKILIDENRGTLEGEFTVPEGHYFVMGDNRDNSNDSRYWGFVPEENLVGKAFMIWMNWDSKADGIAWNRIGDSIQ